MKRFIVTLLAIILSTQFIATPEVDHTGVLEPISEPFAEERVIKHFELKNVKQTVKSTPSEQITGCESFREVTAKYFPASQVDNALFVFKLESGCKHPTPQNATLDSGLCQLHNEHIVDLDRHVKRCSEKYYNARIGSNNWSAWYATCSVTVPGSSLWNPVSLHGLPCGN